VDYLNATVGSTKDLEDVLGDSERLYVLQKLINLRQGKGTRESDQIPLRAMGPVYFNEYEARSEYYSQWLEENLNGNKMPSDPGERHMLLMKMRREAYEKLCDAVYKEKGFSADGIPLRETVEKCGLMDSQARDVLAAH
jgi:aldehyde:ferredoxin oxidoreductase